MWVQISFSLIYSIDFGWNFCSFSHSAAGSGSGPYSARRHLLKNRHRQIVVTNNFPVLALNQTNNKKDENNNCLNNLNELKFCEVSRILISNRTWKFQLSILKNKKVLFLKKIYFKPLSISKQKIFVYWLNFPEGFVENQRVI